MIDFTKTNKDMVLDHIMSTKDYASAFVWLSKVQTDVEKIVDFILDGAQYDGTLLDELYNKFPQYHNIIIDGVAKSNSYELASIIADLTQDYTSINNYIKNMKIDLNRYMSHTDEYEHYVDSLVSLLRRCNDLEAVRNLFIKDLAYYSDGTSSSQYLEVEYFELCGICLNKLSENYDLFNAGDLAYATSNVISKLIKSNNSYKLMGMLSNFNNAQLKERIITSNSYILDEFIEKLTNNQFRTFNYSLDDFYKDLPQEYRIGVLI